MLPPLFAENTLSIYLTKVSGCAILGGSQRKEEAGSVYEGLPKDEAVTLALQELFEQSGYVRYRMSSFESYDYFEH